MAETGGIRAGKAFVEAYLNDTKLQQGLANAQRRMKAWGASMNAMGTKMMLVAGVAAAPLMLAVQKASAMEETMNKFNVVFGTSAKAVKQWSDEFGASIGRSKEQIASFMAGSQDLFVPLGFAADAATDMSKQVTTLTLDLASFNNMADADVLRDLHAALTGSGEVTKKYGVIVSEAAVKQELFNQGIDPKKASDQQKVLARWNIIMQGTTAAHGDAKNSAGSFANQMKTLQGGIVDAAGEIGNVLLPAVTAIVTELAGAAQAFGTWASENTALVLTVAKLTVGVLALGVAMKVLGIAMTLLAAHPVVLVLAATAAGAIALQAVLGDLTKVVIGLTAAWAVFTLNPVLLGLTAVAAAAIYLSEAFSTAGASAEAFSDKADKALAAGDKRRSAALGQMQQLEGLAEKERLNNQEMARAQSIIDALTSTYGDLGLSINTTTGKINGMSEAQVALNAKMAESVKLNIEANLLEGEQNLGKAQQQYIGGEITHEALEARAEVWFLRAASLKARLKALELGEPGALTAPGGAPGGLVPGEAAGKAKDEANKAEEEELRRTLGFAHRVNEIQNGMEADRHKRELAAIEEKYNYEIAMADNAGQTINELDTLRKQELSAARKRHAAEDAEEAKQQAEEVADHEAGLREEIARAEINASAMTAESKRKALLDLDRKAALAEAQRLGIDPELVMRKYDLLRMGTAGQDALGQAKVSTTGGFSAYGVARGVGGYDIQTRIAKAGEDAAKTLQQLLTEAKNAQLVFG